MIDIHNYNFLWDDEKNARLKRNRNLSFENVLDALNNNKILNRVPNSQKYKDFPWADYRHEGIISGFMVEAVIGF